MAPNDRQQMLARLRRLHARHQRAVTRVVALEDEKAELFAEARRLDPPLTFKSMAAIFGVTEAAVMQHLTRRKVKAGEVPAKPRTRKKEPVSS